MNTSNSTALDTPAQFAPAISMQSIMATLQDYIPHQQRVMVARELAQCQTPLYSLLIEIVKHIQAMPKPGGYDHLDERDIPLMLHYAHGETHLYISALKWSDDDSLDIGYQVVGGTGQWTEIDLKAHINTGFELDLSFKPVTLGTLMQPEKAPLAIATVQNNQALLVQKTQRVLSEKEEKHAELIKECERLESRLHFFENKLLPETGLVDNESTFAHLTGMHKASQSDENIANLKRYIKKPSYTLWLEIHGIMLTPLKTLWQTMILVDSTTPRSGAGFNETHYPSAALVKTCIKRAVSLHNRECQFEMDHIKDELKSFKQQMELTHN